MFDYKDFVKNKRLSENLNNDLKKKLDRVLKKADEVIEVLSKGR